MNLSKHKVLVTGAGGFIGGHLVQTLLKMGSEVTALVSYNSAGSSGTLDEIGSSVIDHVRIVRGDIRDRSTVARAMEGCSVVIHLAGLAAVPYSFDSPESYVAVNIGGTLNILEEARRNSCERVLTTSTAAVYGSPQYLPLDEAHPCSANSPYGATKIGAERLSESYYRGFDLPVTTVRPFNTYGPRQSERAVIPSMIAQLLSGADEIKVGDLGPTRDMVYVGDTARAMIEIAQSLNAAGHEINIATGRETSIRDIVETLVNQINPEARIVIDPKRCRLKEGQEDRIYGSNSKLRELTGWSPETSLEEGLKQTIASYRMDSISR
ncbi:MAG: SDR family NAD(P)-dependent oxidoreductase [Akkermansiaceae bacterium]|jgi:NAD dependent epimerase/dehydratase